MSISSGMQGFRVRGRTIRLLGPSLSWGTRPRPERRIARDPQREYWEKTCFYVSPIGEPESFERAHADLFLEELVRPAVKEFDPSLEVVRADELPTSSITASIVDHIAKARLLIADLSFLNPNVFYEVGLRRAGGKPFVLISRSEDPIPSDLKDSRVIRVDMGTVPGFFAEKEERREQITEYARWALSPEGESYFAAEAA